MNMGSITKYAKHLKGNLYEKSYQYLISHFGNFSTENKIKISVEMLKIFNKNGEKTEQGNQIVMLIRNDKSVSEQIASDTRKTTPLLPR